MNARPREPFDAWSHLFGAVTLGTAILALAASQVGAARISLWVYAAASVAMFGASAAYHWLDESKKWLRRLDHSAIYLMIAGTYTPLAVVGFGGVLGRNVLALQWSLAAFGVATSLAMKRPPPAIRLCLYLSMGWMALFFWSPLLALGESVAFWIVAGGVFYTVGAVVYATKKPRLWPGLFGFHELWHVFVLAGAWSHFVAIAILAF